jgi:hypothetical protein
MNRQQNVLNEIEQFLLLKLRRLSKQEMLCDKIEDPILEIVNSLTPTQLLNFFNSVAYRKDTSEFDILSLLRKRSNTGEELPILITGNQKVSDNVYKRFLQNLNPRAFQFLRQNDEKLKELGLSREIIEEYERIRFLEKQEEEENENKHR